MIACPQLATASCAFGLGKRKDCAFQPMLMRREPLGGGLFVEEFVELNPRARRGSGAATAPLYAESAPRRSVFRAGKKRVYSTWFHSLDYLTRFLYRVGRG